jgi:hypothetical protein
VKYFACQRIPLRISLFNQRLLRAISSGAKLSYTGSEQIRLHLLGLAARNISIHFRHMSKIYYSNLSDKTSCYEIY